MSSIHRARHGHGAVQMQSPGAQSVQVPLSDVPMSPAGQYASVAPRPLAMVARQTSGSPGTRQCGRQDPPPQEPHAAASTVHSSVVVVLVDVAVMVVFVEVVDVGGPAQTDGSSLQSASVAFRQKFMHAAFA